MQQQKHKNPTDTKKKPSTTTKQTNINKYKTVKRKQHKKHKLNGN
jgi:hypothetical protein